MQTSLSVFGQMHLDKSCDYIYDMRVTWDGLSAALIPSPLDKIYSHCHPSAGSLKCAKPLFKSQFSTVKF